jgi:hypothetical protein
MPSDTGADAANHHHSTAPFPGPGAGFVMYWPLNEDGKVSSGAARTVWSKAIDTMTNRWPERGTTPFMDNVHLPVVARARHASSIDNLSILVGKTKLEMLSRISSKIQRALERPSNRSRSSYIAGY